MQNMVNVCFVAGRIRKSVNAIDSAAYSYYNATTICFFVYFAVFFFLNNRFGRAERDALKMARFCSDQFLSVTIFCRFYLLDFECFVFRIRFILSFAP